MPTVEPKTNEDDLYTDSIRDVVNAYMKEYYNNYFSGHYYSFYDINGDGIEELLLSTDGSNDNKCLHTVFVIQDGVAVWQEQFAPYPYFSPPPILFKNGTIWSSSGIEEPFYYSYYRFIGGELKFQTLLKDDYGKYYRMHVQYGPIAPITKEEFDRLQKEFEGDGQVVELDWKPLAEYGR